MTKDEALRLASVVLDHCYGHHAVNDDMIEQTAKVIQAALEAKDEPFMASYEHKQYGYYKDESGSLKLGDIPQRTWVGLTDEEIKEMGLDNYQQVVRETEAKLKDKNESKN
jgi:hypothetical protein